MQAGSRGTSLMGQASRPVPHRPQGLSLPEGILSMNRYQRVREILATAAEGSPADYGSLGPFWNLRLDQLLHATLYDGRLIAPAEEAPHSCCSRPAAGSRSSRSGLIIGLRGEAP